MQESEDKVVLLLSPQISSTDSVVIARFSILGLSAFGETIEIAFERLLEMYAVYIQDLREHGLLESCLQNSGVEWYWASEYDEPYLDVSSLREGNRPEIPMNTRELIAA